MHQFDLTGAFGKTTNGGLDWEITTLPTNGLMKAIYFHDDKIGCIGGFNRDFNGGINCTEDGGETWVSSENESTGVINYFDFTDSLNGWAVTTAGINAEYGEVLKTSDGGQSWSVEYSGVGSLNAISITKPNNIGYAVGYNNLLKTTIATRVENLEAASIIKVFPNPFHNKINVQLYNVTSTKIEIYNLLGHLILEKGIETEEDEIELGNLQDGTYILKALNEDQIDIKTIFKF